MGWFSVFSGRSGKMLSKQVVQEDEERIRKKVRELADERRQEFFKLSEKKIKDPDTYATLNYILVGGLHHFYLGRWARGLADLIVSLFGIALLFTDSAGVGLLLIVAVVVVELYALFRSQIIVQDHNNKVMEGIYERLPK